MEDKLMQRHVEHVEEVKVLLVGADSTDARMVRAALNQTQGAMEVGQGLFAATDVESLAQALDLLARQDFDVVLVDLQLPDSDGLEALAEVRAAAMHVAIVVLAGLDDDGQALAAIRRGAQDYVARDRLDGHLLRRTIRYAMERKRAELQLLRHAQEVEAAHARTEQQAAELRARAEHLDRINRELDDFAYIASHDLKEPLRGIAAYCEILLEDYQDKLDHVGRRRLHTLVDLCKRLESLISDLLTYCRVGGTRPTETGVDLNEVVRKSLETLRPVIERRRGSVRVVGRLPVVTGDATLISMALSNLITNGLKFNDRAQPQVEIGCVSTEPPTLYVRDDGIGIDPKHHEAIFAIFRRLHGRQKYDGTGAGLTIVRKIVQAHGGRIWLESEPGMGSTFCLTLAPAGQKQAPEPVLRPPHWVGRPRQRALQMPRQER